MAPPWFSRGSQHGRRARTRSPDRSRRPKSSSRKPTSARASLAGKVGALLALVAASWSLFQVWYASPLPFIFGFGIFNDTEARSIHLTFAVFLAFVAFPAFKRSSRTVVPLSDWVLALIGAFCASYLFLFYNADRRASGAAHDARHRRGP